jgi:hypothetical protein
MKTYSPALLALIAGLGLSLASGNVIASTKAPVGDTVAGKSEPAKSPMRMTDSQMDQVVAGYDNKITGNHPPGHNIVYNTSIITTSNGGTEIVTTCYFTNGSGNISGKPCP